MFMVVHMEYYSAIKKEQNDAIRSDIDGPRDCHTEWQLCQTKTNTIYCLYSEYKIKVEINLFTEK